MRVNPHGLQVLLRALRSRFLYFFVAIFKTYMRN